MIKKRHPTSLCGSSKMAQTLYKNRHDRMLRPLYQTTLEKYEFSESENYLPWYKQSHPVPCLENDKAKVFWDIPWDLEKCSKNSANRYECTGQNEQEVVHNGWNCVHII